MLLVVARGHLRGRKLLFVSGALPGLLQLFSWLSGAARTQDRRRRAVLRLHSSLVGFPLGQIEPEAEKELRAKEFQRRGTMTSCGGAEDDMKNFTEAVNMYDPAGFDTPPDVTGRLIADFSSLVHKAETFTAIGTIMTDVEEEGRYPLLGTKSESRLMPSIDEHIGEGTTGHVYSIATRFGPMAVKFQEHSSGSGQAFVPGNGSMNVPMNEFALEVKFQLHMSSIGISPNVYNAWTGAYSTTWGDGQQDVLVMDRLKETLFQKTSRERDYTGGVMELVSKMHDNNVFHGDMHSGNIMVDGGKPWMIDFGRSKPMPATDEGKRWAMVHDYVLLYTSLLRRSELKPIIKNKILELAPAKTVMGTAFDLGE